MATRSNRLSVPNAQGATDAPRRLDSGSISQTSRASPSIGPADSIATRLPRRRASTTGRALGSGGVLGGGGAGIDQNRAPSEAPADHSRATAPAKAKGFE